MNAGASWRAAAFAHLDARLDPHSRAPLAVAVSGGGDSTALLHLAHGWAVRRDRSLLVLTVDHGLNSEGAVWARFVEDAAAALSRPVRTLIWTAPKPTTGIPAAARAARHALLAAAAREAGARAILLGHTADDLAEADHMRAEGASLGRLRAWSPSPAWPEGRGVMLLRPLLEARRGALRAWLSARGLPWIEDPANADLRFTRSRARAALVSCSIVIEEVRSEQRERAGPTPAPAFREAADAPGGLLLDRAELLGSADAPAVLSAALLCASGQIRPPRGPSMIALLTRLADEPQFTATLAGARLEAGPESVLLTRDPGRRGLPHLPAAAGETVVWDGRFEVDAGEAGIFRPAGGVARRLPRGDKARLRAVRPACRPTLPVLETASGAVRLVTARPLGAERLRAALGGYACEADVP